MVHCFCAAYVPSQQALLSSSMTNPPALDSGADEWSGAGSFRHYDATERTGVSHRTEYVHMHMPRATCHVPHFTCTGVSHRTEYVHMHMPRATCHVPHAHARASPTGPSTRLRLPYSLSTIPAVRAGPSTGSTCLARRRLVSYLQF